VLASAGEADKPADAADAPRPPARVRPSELAALLGDRSLRIGDEGNLVRAFQLALAKLGYDLKGTGTFGGATDTAVTHFQQSRGLEVDGEIGPQTAATIDAVLADGAGATTPTAKQPEPGAPDGAGQPIWLLEGLRWMNTKEAPGAADNPDILEWARAEGGAIAKSYHSDSIPWCALYANMVLTKVGLQGTETLWGARLVQLGHQARRPGRGRVRADEAPARRPHCHRRRPRSAPQPDVPRRQPERRREHQALPRRPAAELPLAQGGAATGADRLRHAAAGGVRAMVVAVVPREDNAFADDNPRRHETLGGGTKLTHKK
jgi:Putative peptidoglycan binding domain